MVYTSGGMLWGYICCSVLFSMCWFDHEACCRCFLEQGKTPCAVSFAVEEETVGPLHRIQSITWTCEVWVSSQLRRPTRTTVIWEVSAGRDQQFSSCMQPLGAASRASPSVTLPDPPAAANHTTSRRV